MEELRSERLSLGTLQHSDISHEYLSTLNDADYMSFSRQSGFLHTFNSQSEYIDEFAKSHNLLLGVKDCGRLVGTINCYVNFSKMTLNLGFLIFKNYAKNGYAKEALGALIPYLMKQFPGATLEIGTNKKNFPIQLIAKHFGFINEKYTSDLIEQDLKFIRKIPSLNRSSSPLIPDFILDNQNIGIAAFDAGGAEQISWLIRNLKYNVIAYMDGPAKRIIQSAHPSIQSTQTMDDILDCDLIISGSGWMSHLEVEVIKQAKLRNIPCLTILDHWVNYLERFGAEEGTQPQMLAVTNTMALEIAQDKFPNRFIWLIPDLQINAYTQALRGVQAIPKCILVLLEPVSMTNTEFEINIEIIQDLVASAIAIKQARGLERMIVRLHPSQIENPTLISNLEALAGKFEISKGVNLINDLEIADVVVGMSSYVLYISCMCGIDTYSSFASNSTHWTRWFPQIKSLPRLS